MNRDDGRKKKEIIRRKFSRAANVYDKHAMIQKRCAHHLLETLPAGFEPGSILELGCGSGNYSRLLQEKYPGAAVTALDFSGEMLQTARRKTGKNGTISFMQREVEEYLAGAQERFSLITSNATMQWFMDLAGAFGNMARILDAKGLVHLSIFGPRTLDTLGKALRAVVDPSLVLPPEKFIDRVSLRDIASSCFDDVTIEESNLNLHFNSFLELLRQIHNTGTGGFTDPQPRFTKNTIAELDRYLSRQSGREAPPAGYDVGYQVFFLTASGPR